MKTKMVQQKKPRVLFLYDFPLRGGGSGVYIKYLALRLREAYGYDLAIAAPDKTSVDSSIRQFTLKLPQVPVYISRPGLEKAKKYNELTSSEIADLYHAFIKETIKAVEDFKPDIIHVHHILLNAWAARVIRSIKGIKFIITSHGSCIFVASKDRRYFGMTRDGLRAATAVTTVSAYTRTKLLKIFGKDLSAKTRIIPGGVRLSLFPAKKSQAELDVLRKKYSLASGSIVLFTGRLISEKGIEYIVKAANKIHGQLVIVGDGPQKKVIEEIMRKNSLTNVFMLGFVDHDNLINLYYLADVFLSLSFLDEPVPTVIFEAMAAGLPVVTTRRGGIPSAVKDGYNGFFVRPRNIADIATKVNSLLAAPILRKRMGERSREIVKKRFIWTKIAARFDRLYKDIYNNE